PLAAPSANLSNQLSPTSDTHVLNTLGDYMRLIVDSGQSQVGIESTVLDLTVSPPRVLRPGMIHEESLIAVTGELGSREATRSGVFKSPGMLRKHYAPNVKLVIRSWRDDEDLRAQLRADHQALAECH